MTVRVCGSQLWLWLRLPCRWAGRASKCPYVVPSSRLCVVCAACLGLVSRRRWCAPVSRAPCAADVAVVGVRNPFEVVKQQMQVGLHKNSKQALRNILRVEGIRGLYAGYFSTLVREVPFDALQFVMYEAIKARYRRYKGDEPLVLWENCAIGSCAGAMAAGVTTPLDVVKTRLMTQTGVAASERYTGVVHALRTIYAQEGARALFSGVRQRVAWIGLGGAIFFGSFEELRRVMTPDTASAGADVAY